MIWFTSDMHLGHEKALDFTIRPWQQIDEMNEGIIANINAKVKKKDELYILGDYSFRIPALEAAVQIPAHLTTHSAKNCSAFPDVTERISASADQ